MLIPYNTDAPIYHFPKATLGLMIGNIVCFITTAGGSSHYDDWVLAYGTGLHPLQWISSLFFHIGPAHLVGNMLFLWVFGLVVEGKVGWGRFLAIYLGMGILQNALEQLVMEWVQTNAAGSAGASGVIFGLMTIAMVWAPRNDIQCYLFAFLRVFEFGVAISTMCVLYVVVEVAMAVFHGFSIGAELLHLVGASLGWIVGCSMLNRGLVDCENWDLFSLWRGKNKSTVNLDHKRHLQPGEAIRELSESGSFSFTTKAKTHAARIDELIGKRKFGSALRELQQLQHLVPNHQLEEQSLGDLIRGLYKQKRWIDVTPLLREFIDRFPHNATSMHLRLAAILLEVDKRPKASLRAAEEIDEAKLRPRQARELAKIRKAAGRLIESGHLELDR